MSDERIYELLKELQETVLQQAATLNELQRRIDNIIIPGKVKALSEDNKRVVISHGSCETPEIKWLANSAGEVIDYRAPSIDEQVLLLNLTGGKDTGKCIALVGLTSADYPFTVNEPSEHVRLYPDGTKARYHHDEKRLTLELAGDASITAAGNTDITTQGTTKVTSTGSVTVESSNADVNVSASSKVKVTAGSEAKVEAPKVLLNSSGSATHKIVNGTATCPFTKLPHVTAPSTKVHAG